MYPELVSYSLSINKDHHLHLTNATVLAIGSINGDTSLKFLVGVITLFILSLSVAEEEYGLCHPKPHTWTSVRIRPIPSDLGRLSNIFAS